MSSDIEESTDDGSQTGVEYITDPKLKELDDQMVVEKHLKDFFMTGRVKDATHVNDYDDDDDDEYAPESRTKSGNAYSTEDRYGTESIHSYREEFLVSALTRHPNLAGMRFKLGKTTLPGFGQHKMYPFTYMLCSGHPLRSLKVVYKMFPEALGFPVKVGKTKMLPIGYACQERNREVDLIRFLVCHCPAANPKAFPLAINIAIRTKAPTSTIEALLEGDPQSVSMADETMFLFALCSLSVACQVKGVPKEMSKLLAKAFCKASPLHFTCDQKVVRRLHDLRLLEKVLNSVSHSFTYICDDQIEAQSLFFSFVGPRRQEGRAFAERRTRSNETVLESLLLQNDSIDSVSFAWYKPRELTISKLTYSRKTKDVNIAGIEGRNIVGLSTFLDLNPRSLHIEFSQQIPEEDVERMFRGRGARMALKHLSLDNVEIPAQGLLNVLIAARQLQSLERLVIQYCPLRSDMRSTVAKDQLTEALVRLLDQQKLSTLELKGLELDVDCICNALARNRSLRTFCCSELREHHGESFVDLLRNGNRTLVNLRNYSRTLPFVVNHCELVEYYSQLNRFGRSKAQDAGVSISTVVGLLCKPLSEINTAESDDDPPFWHHDTLNLFNIHYSLLSQSPHVWSSLVPRDSTLTGRFPGKRKKYQPCKSVRRSRRQRRRFGPIKIGP